MLSLYGGGSILALDRYLHSVHVEGVVFGYESFIGVNHLLYMAGFYIEDSTRILAFTDLGSGFATNIYTALRRYINDFGCMGMIIAQFLFGAVFSAMYLIIKNSKSVNYFHVFYSIMFMVLVYQAIDDQFLVSFMSVTQVFTVMFTYIIYRVICRRPAISRSLFY